MLDIFRGLKNLLKVSRIHIDGSVFRLHYNATVMILIAFSVIVTTKQFVGNPIECIHSKDVTEAVINTFCWIQSTYTMNDAYDVLRLEQKKYPYPGVGPDEDENRDQRRYHKYYQWVCFMLFFQAVLFYIPRWLWKNWEGGKIEALTFDLHIGFVSESERKQKKNLLLEYLWDNLGHHSWWAGRYFLCEIMCFVNVLGQMWLMNRFFEGEFLEYGLRVVEFMETEQEDRVDPMIRVFPRVTKCHFRKYGSSGKVETHDAMCILPLNVVNEKIYIFLWFWFIILTCLTFIVLTVRLVIFSLPRVRMLTLYVRFRLVPKKMLQTLVARTNMGDWFLFFMLGQNIDGNVFKEIMTELADRLDQHDTYIKGEATAGWA